MKAEDVQLTRLKFIRWLRRHIDMKWYSTYTSESCPIATYLKDQTMCNDVVVPAGDSRISVNGCAFEKPAWAAKFVSEFDSEGGDDNGCKDANLCLRLLGAV